ncbi:ABC transporter ATP-binding protein [Phaeovibrio sulfidiphilus]|uniref:ABC transporter ATP-binding protein n=1 Tax=Phaeovibrio sulfidiphilus TaxID=1220600 RepID=A0A8J7CD19_9PROT|nr:ABC transporter ATP-binding protein [Phaeovibrio sulfidiphilus]MBE1236559.1 ABC transporter ATP-binding protein [Phaeovibrio sulfidiphilus]
MTRPLIEVENLHVRFGSGEGAVHAVRGVSFSVNRGETLALVGESGSGKSVTALSLPRLLPPGVASWPEGIIRLEGQELLNAASPESALSERQMRSIRAERIAMIFQEPMTSLNPLHTIERQIAETLMVHQGLSRRACHDRVRELLDLVGLERLKDRLGALPHELSGGQRQRVMIAMAIANEPDLLIADEPTTALDVTVQAQILALLEDLRSRFNMALLFISHDLGLVRRMADRVAVMKDGLIVEQAPTRVLFSSPSHPYTRQLLDSAPRGEPPVAQPGAPVVLSGDGIRVSFPLRKDILGRVTEEVRAVDGVSLSVRAGETLGIVGESGSGKTTLGLALLRLVRSKGPVVFLGDRIDGLGRRAMRDRRKGLQIVFQDPFGSLSPRRTIEQIVGEGLSVHGLARSKDEARALVTRVLSEVGLGEDVLTRFPHEFSGGQRQRISIARALVLRPSVIVLDEPTSALDVTIQAQIVDLLRDIQKRYTLAYVFISHDLRVVRALASRILVMKDGRAVEHGDTASIFEAPKEPYTRALLAAAFNGTDFRAAASPPSED